MQARVTLFNLEGIRPRDTRGYSSAGRAPALQAGGRRFDPDYLHHPQKSWRFSGDPLSRFHLCGGNEFRLAPRFWLCQNACDAALAAKQKISPLQNSNRSPAKRVRFEEEEQTERCEVSPKVEMSKAQFATTRARSSAG